MACVREGDVALIRFSAAVICDGHGAVASEDGQMRLRAGDRGAIGGIDIAVVGMLVGECKKMLIPPEEAFGTPDPALVRKLPRRHFRHLAHLKPGSLVRISTKSGKQIEVVAREVSEDTVTVDANHPLAGMQLSFEMTVLAIECADGRETATD